MKVAKANRNSAAVQAAIRQRVVNYLDKGKGSQQSAADIFMLSLSAVKKIWKRYQLYGDGILQADKRGPKQSNRRLSAKQVEYVTALLCQSTPQDHALPNTLWTAKAVRELIKKRPVLSTQNDT